MQRAMLWFKCAAMHDPVRPVLKQPAVIGWEAKQRQVDLVIERAFKGAELLRRMKGWVTVDVEHAIELAEKHGFRPVNPLVPLNPKLFIPENGVVYKVPVQPLKPPSGRVVEAILEFWVEVRNPGV